MRLSTWAYLAVFLVAAAALALLVRAASAPRVEDGRRIYRLACWGGERETRELTALVDGINARATDFRIKLMPIPSDYQTKLCTMIAGGTAPDFFYLSQEHVAAFAAQGALLDLTELVDSDDQDVTDLSTYYPSVLEEFRWKGRLYGLPWIAQPVVLYCNVEAFRQAGVPLPDGTWDRARFVREGRRLTRDTDGDGRIDQWGFVLDGWPPWQMWVWQNGAEVIDPATGRLNLTAPAVTAAADAYAGLIHRDRIAPKLSVVSETGSSEMFRDGKVAMFMGGAADDLDRIPGLEVAVAEVPAGPTGIRATFAWVAGLHVRSGIRDEQAAFEAYTQLLDAIQRWKISAPRRPLAERLEEFEPRKAAAADVIRASMEYMRTPASSPHQAEFETLFHEEFLDPILRTGEPAETLAPRVQRILEKVR